MAFFQWQQIDPSEAAREQALQDAFAAAEISPTWGEVTYRETNPQQHPAGSFGWMGLEIEGRRTGRVTGVWWTDAAGRRHWYIEADQYWHDGEPNSNWRCRYGVPGHPLWVIAPNQVVEQGEEADRVLLVVCDCGEVGTPESLGWMGPCCGPCHDRRTEDTTWVPPSVRAYQAQQSSVTGLAFLDEDRIVTCGYRDSEVCLRNPRAIRHLKVGKPDEGGAMGLALLPGEHLVVALNRSRVRCHNINEDATIWHRHCPGELMGLAASPLGNLIAVDGVSYTYLLLADSGEGNLLSDDFAECTFSFDSELLYCFDHGERVILAIDPIAEDISETGLQFGGPEEDDCYSLVGSPVRRLLASGGDQGRVRLGDPEEGRWLWIQDGPAGLVANLAFTPDGQVLVSGHARTLVYWDVANGACVGKLTLPGEGLQALAFSPNGQTLAVGDSQGVVRLLPWRELLEYCIE